MSELRQDPITRDWIIVNPERAERPTDRDASENDCPFCPGNEHRTPGEVDRDQDADGRWRVRVVPNRYPALTADPGAEPTADAAGTGWRRQVGYGHHEVIVESPDHRATLGTLPGAQLRRVLAVWLRRYRALAAQDGRIRQVVLFRNQGARAGTSLTHPHAQIIATPVVSPAIRRRMADEVAYYDATGACGLCDVLATEFDAAVRVVHASERFVTIAPFASRVPYQLQIVPRTHCPSFAEIDDALLDDLAPHLGRVIGALERTLAEPHYNLVVTTPPLDQVHRLANHWFIEIQPRLTTPAGFEMGSRIVINTRPAEQAAAQLRAALAAH